MGRERHCNRRHWGSAWLYAWQVGRIGPAVANITQAHTCEATMQQKNGLPGLHEASGGASKVRSRRSSFRKQKTRGQENWVCSLSQSQKPSTSKGSLIFALRPFGNTVRELTATFPSYLPCSLPIFCVPCNVMFLSTMVQKKKVGSKKKSVNAGSKKPAKVSYTALFVVCLLICCCCCCRLELHFMRANKL